MTDFVTVTVAPFQGVPVSPHPSGLSELGSLTLQGGDTLRVTLAEAERLFSEGRVLHWITGKPKPAEKRERSGLAFMDAHGNIMSHQPSWSREAQYPSEMPPVDDRPPPPRAAWRGGPER